MYQWWSRGLQEEREIAEVFGPSLTGTEDEFRRKKTINRRRKTTSLHGTCMTQVLMSFFWRQTENEDFFLFAF